MFRLLACLVLSLSLLGTGCGRQSSSDDSGAPSGGAPSGGGASRDKSVHVEGYYNKDGKWVKPYDRAAPGEGVKKRK